MSLECQINFGYRILGLFPMNIKSCFMMYKNVMKHLAKRGHQVDVISQFPLDKPMSNYTDIYMKAPFDDLVNNFTLEGGDDYNGFNQFKSYGTETGADACDTILKQDQMQRLLKNPPNDPPYDLIIVEIFTATCTIAFGKHLNVPVIGITTSVWPWSHSMVGNPENLAISPNTFLNYHNRMNFQQRFYNFLYTLNTHLILDYFRSPIDQVTKKYFGSNAPGIKELEQSLALLLVNSHPSLNDPLPRVPAWIEVGGLHVQDDGPEISADHQKWMDESTDGFIYFTFGSMMMIESLPPHVIEIFYKSFAKIAPVRIFMKIPRVEMLPPGLPKNVRTFTWISQIKVLKHKNIKAFITHGGLMGTQEAIAYGIPMIGIALFMDQYHNIDRYVQKKIAIRLDYENINEKNLDFALKEMLYNPTYKNEAKELSIKFLDRPTSALDTACYWVEYIGRHGSKALRSPTLDYTWWQLQLLDIYAVLLLAITMSIIIFIMTIRYFITKVCYKKNKKSQSHKGKKFN